LKFEQLYDLFQKDVDYQSLITPFLKYLKKDKPIIDAGCGSGHLMNYLSSLGYDLIGIDKNPLMLKLASERLISNNQTPKLFQHNLNKKIPFKVNQIISFLDVINYFKKPEKLIKTLTNALLVNGTLIIDLYKEPFRYLEEGKVGNYNYLWKVIPFNKKIKHIITITSNDNNFNYKLTQYIYSLDKYLKIFKKYNLLVKKVSGFDHRKHYFILKKVK